MVLPGMVLPGMVPGMVLPGMVLPGRSGLGARAGALLHRGVSAVRQGKRRRLTSSAVTQSSSDIPRNYAGIQMIHRNLWKQLFPDQAHGDSAETILPATKAKVAEHLEKFGLWDRDAPNKPSASKIELPPLLGGNLPDHFEELGRRQAEPYMRESMRISAAKLPPMPTEWLNVPGWTRYAPDGSTWSVEAPDESAIVFDVEVCVREGNYPTLAIAASGNAWYGWVSKRLHGYSEETEPYFAVYDGEGILMDSTPGTRELIPLETGSDTAAAKIVIGHNVAYDRQRVLEQYNLHQSGTRFIDTMSLHMATSGLSTQQIATWQMRKRQGKKGGAGGVQEAVPDVNEPETAMNWVQEASPPSLKSCYKLWCNEEMTKEARNIFVKGYMKDIHDNFQTLMQYCANDVAVTHEVYKKVFAHYNQMYPSYVTFAGMLEVGQSYLPTDERWKMYVQRSQFAFDSVHAEYEEMFIELADRALPLVITGLWELDPWLRNLDWSFTELEFTTGRRGKDGGWTANGMPKLKEAGQELTHIPKWYKKIFPNVFDAEDFEEALADRALSTGDRVLPYLLKMAWREQNFDGPGPTPEYPLHFHDDHKWGYLVPNEDAAYHSGNGPYGWKAPDRRYQNTHQYFKIPTNEGEGGVCGSPFSKEYGDLADDEILVSPYYFFKGIYDAEDGAYWNTARARIMNQFIVWQKQFKGQIKMSDMAPFPADQRDPAPVRRRRHVKPTRPMSREYQVRPDEPGLGAILPQVVPFGTVTRRAVERTWLTAANPSPRSIGSELKSRIRAPKGYKFVGADVDSQELWIAAVMGDAQMAKCHGSTALGWMTLQGEKSEGTDMHSKTASIIGISRDQAKILNYARIYGAAQQFAAQLLVRFNPNAPQAAAYAKAEQLYTSTKGAAVTKNDRARGNYTAWEGGSESETFNKLESIARMKTPVTPVLKAQISSGLQPRYFGAQSDQFLRSRVNWCVQSSAVDYLHILVVSMTELFTRYDIKGRYCISIHDEIRYIVADEDVDRAAYALHLSNMYVRALFSHAVGIPDLPEGVAFFSAVDIDHVIRKEVYLDCLTPSNMIPEAPGESVDIHTIGERVGWSLEKRR